MELGPCVGPIYTIILIVSCIFFMVLEWTMPREDIDYVKVNWNPETFKRVSQNYDYMFFSVVLNIRLARE